MKKRTYKYSNISAEDFIRIWQSAKSNKAFCAATGLKSAHASSRAAFYRRKGIDLKKFKRGAGIVLDIPALKKIAKSAGK